MITTINEFRKIFESKQLDLILLEKDLEIFRKNMEDENEWSDYKPCFKGTCQDVTNRLETYLKDKGYNAVRTRGYYKNAGDDYYPDTEDWDLDDQMLFSRQYHRNGDSSNGLKFPHWWIEIDKYIIDLTEDQFHPDFEDDYRIGIYKKPDKNYKKG